MKFYTYHQNNSGGRFITDNYVAPVVIIEASSTEQADRRAQDIGIYFDGCSKGRDCSCCGDRWYPVSSYDEADVPTIYGKTDLQAYVDSRDNIFNKKVYVYRDDGTKTVYSSNKIN